MTLTETIELDALVSLESPFADASAFSFSWEDLSPESPLLPCPSMYPHGEQ